MTNEIEKQFFDTFGIEPNKEYYCPNCDTKLEKWNTPKGMQYICGNDPECDYFLDSYDKEFKEILNNLGFRVAYPQITDRILLEIIAKICWTYRCTANNFELYEVSTVKDLKEAVLKHAIKLSKNDDYIYSSVQALFEEG